MSQPCNNFPTFNLDNSYTLDSIQPEKDAPNYFAYMNHQEVRRFVSFENLPKSIRAAEVELSYWRNLFLHNKGFYWALRSCNTEEIIGTIGFNSISLSHLKGEISYDLCYDYWNKGIMNKALKNITHFAFNTLRLVRIQASVSYNNHRSKKLLQKCGFNAEGILSKFEILDGQHTDFILYALIR